MGEGHAGICSDAKSGCNTWNDLEWHATIRHRPGFFAAAPEHVRIPALEPHYRPTGTSSLDHQIIDLALRICMLGPLLADVEAFGIGTRKRQDISRSEVVIEDQVGGL